MKKTITIGAGTENPITINRFGYGTMRLPGDFVWGEPKNRDEALEILKTASKKGIHFLDSLPKKDDKIALLAEKYKVSTAQINLAWLLHFNDLILPIPGTSQLKHFEENITSRDIQLTAADMAFLG